MKSAPEPRWRASLATRLALAWMILIAVVVAVSGLAMQRANHRHVLDTLQTGVERDAEGVRLKLETWASAFRQDVGFCAGSPLLKAFLTQEDDQWRSLLEEEFGAMLAGKPNYFQIRVLGIGGEENGKELLRIDRVGDQLAVMPIDKLQSKSDRTYFREAVEVPPGEVYLSEINLNRDFGEISLPHIPTLRAAASIAASGRMAMIIINANLDPLFEELLAMSGEGRKLRLAGEDGGYLVHPRPELEFQADLGGDVYFGDEFPEEDEIMGRSEVNLGGRKISAIISLPGNSWRALLSDSRGRTLWVSLLAALAGAVGGIAILLPLARRLRTLERALREYEVGTEPKGLPEEGTDEVGIVVTRFRELGTRVREDMENLRIARHEAEEATRVKEEFLAIMTHEIRTPMNAVVGLIRALGDNQPPVHQMPLLNSLRAASSNLMALLNSALDYTKLKAGHIEFTEENFDAAAVAEEVGRAYAPMAMAKGLEFRLGGCAEALPVRGDPVRLRQVLNNLLANAVKFTAEGNVTLDVEACEAERRQIRFTVSDTGPGVDMSERERIFAPFAQASAANHRGEAGTGLGLSIARALLERQGGSLTLASRPGEGAAFTAELTFASPRSPHEIPALSSATEPHATVVWDGLRILCVEDVEFNRLILEITLGGTGAELVFAETGAEAVRLAKARIFDIALLDLQLPDLRGETLAGLLREIQPNLPMLAVTAQASESVAETCREAGIEGVVLKPFEPEALMAEMLRIGKFEGRPMEPRVRREDKLARLAAENLELAASDLARAFREGRSETELPRIRHRLATTIGKYGLESVERLLEEVKSGEIAPEEAVEALRAEAGKLRNFALS